VCHPQVDGFEEVIGACRKIWRSLIRKKDVNDDATAKHIHQLAATLPAG